MGSLLFVKKIILLIAFTSHLYGWGFYAHKKIQSDAIKILPTELKIFFENNKNIIIENSIAPDKWKFKDKKEGPRHYIDLDRYDTFPFEKLPRNYQMAVQKFGKKIVNENGTVPWRVVEFANLLTEAFKNRNHEKILFYASALGHYVSDANVPLHTTENYNGQLTFQHGLHSRFESELPERFNFELNPKQPQIIKDLNSEIFDNLLNSFVLNSKILQSDKQSLFDEKGNPNFKIKKKKNEYSYKKKYYEIFYRLIGSDLKIQMERAANSTASFWFTAWVNAGSPKL